MSDAGPQKTIPRNASIYIVSPTDGNYGSRTYKGSGVSVANAFKSAFSRYSDHVIVGPFEESTKALLETAKQKECGYAVVPRIVSWEDRATEWSGKPDRIEIMVKVFNTEESASVTSSSIKGKSSWLPWAEIIHRT